MHHAMGYCGSGMRMGQRVPGLKEGRTGFDDIAFPTLPFHTGNPWFPAPPVMFYRWRDG